MGELIVNNNFFILVQIFGYFFEILIVIRTMSLIFSDIRYLKRHGIRREIILLTSFSNSKFISSIRYHFQCRVI